MVRFLLSSRPEGAGRKVVLDATQDFPELSRKVSCFFLLFWPVWIWQFIMCSNLWNWMGLVVNIIYIGEGEWSGMQLNRNGKDQIFVKMNDQAWNLSSFIFELKLFSASSFFSYESAGGKTNYQLEREKKVDFRVTGTILNIICRVRSGQGKLEKSGKIRKGVPVTRKSGNIDYSPIVREFEDSWVENQNSSHNPLKQKKSTEIIIIGWWSRSFDRNSV